MNDTHSHTAENLSPRTFVFAIVLNLGLVAGEGIAGHFGHSTALIADAGHNLTDVLALLLSGGALWMANRPASQRRTYGFRRATILASLGNALLLFLVAGWLIYKSVFRLVYPQHVSGLLVIAVAVTATILNGLTAILFMRNRNKDLNLRAAFIHMAADTALSLGVVVAGVGILLTRWEWLDPSMSLVIVAAILWTTWKVLRDSFNLSLDAVPANIDPSAVQSYLNTLSGVESVHHLHVWAMSTTEVAMTVHLVKPDGQLDDNLLREIDDTLLDQFGINHSSIQLEQGNGRDRCSLIRQ